VLNDRHEMPKLRDLHIREVVHDLNKFYKYFYINN
jgi:hypothetical protein